MPERNRQPKSVILFSLSVKQARRNFDRKMRVEYVKERSGQAIAGRASFLYEKAIQVL
jgi:hypothetical protein